MSTLTTECLKPSENYRDMKQKIVIFLLLFLISFIDTWLYTDSKNIIRRDHITTYKLLCKNLHFYDLNDYIALKIENNQLFDASGKPLEFDVNNPEQRVAYLNFYQPISDSCIDILQQYLILYKIYLIL